MKSSSRTPSATSLPRAPRDEIDARSVRYLAMMALRTVCFILMVVVTPYGWYTWVFGLAAIFLPYLAVVGANVGQESRRNRREDPEFVLPSTPPAATAPPAVQVIRIHEAPTVDASGSAAEKTDASQPVTPTADSTRETADGGTKPEDAPGADGEPRA